MIATDDLHASVMLEALGAGDKFCVFRDLQEHRI